MNYPGEGLVRLAAYLFWFVFLLFAGCSNREATQQLEEQLLEAAERGDPQQVGAVLQHGIDVNTQDICFFTPLIKSAQHGNLAVVRQLLKAGAMINLSDKGGYTALMQAAGNNHPDTVALLLEAGADPDRTEDTHGWTALIWAAKQGFDEPVRLLLAQGARHDIRDDRNMTAADWARQEGHATTLAILGQASGRLQKKNRAD